MYADSGTGIRRPTPPPWFSRSLFSSIFSWLILPFQVIDFDGSGTGAVLAFPYRV